VSAEDRLLTDAELDHMRALWELQRGTVRQVHAALPQGDTARAYTTVATILKIMETKGFISSSRDGRALVYAPVLARQDYQTRSVRHVVDTVFGGDAVSLVRRLVQAESLDADALAEMRALVEGLDE
jgi:predicted transcriptional regulator